MPHKPGHGTQRQRIERQSRGQTAQPISRAAQKASRAAVAVSYTHLTLPTNREV